jgi:hypothetical protein
VTAHPTSVGNRLLAALPPADLGLLTPHFEKISFEPDDVLVRSGDELDQVYFPKAARSFSWSICRTDKPLRPR